MKYPSTIAAAPRVETLERRDMGPVEVAMVSVVATAIAGVLAGVFLERPWDELWRWLVGGAMLPMIIVVTATLARLIAWTIGASTWRVENAIGRDINGDGVIGAPETIRLIPVRAQSPRIRLSGEDEGYEPDDLRALLHHAYTSVDRHTARGFYGMTLPSGRQITGYTDIAPFLKMLERSNLLVDRGERRAGRLIGDEANALDLFGL